jgi:uncharacterized membrane protein
MIAIIGLATVAGFIHAVSSQLGRRAAGVAMPLPTLVLLLAAGAMLAVAPGWLLPGATLLPDPWWLAPLIGVLLAGGNIGLVAALQRGPAAVVVPVLSSKVVLVAVGMALLGGHVPLTTWGGAVLAALGITVIQSGPRPAGAVSALLLAALAAGLYAGFDLLFANFGRQLGIAGMLPAATAWGLIVVLPLLPWARWPTAGRGVALWCAGLNGLQLIGLVTAIILAGDAALPNVLYGCRALWSVLLGLLPLPFLFTGASDRAGMGRRCVGAALIAVAIALTLLGAA